VRSYLLQQKAQVSNVDAAGVHCLGESRAVRYKYGMLEQIFDEQGHLYAH
jgi:hypothetical protein